MIQGAFDPAKRRLCPDGACIGVVGDDGRCRVCGRASDGSATASPSATPSSSFGPDDAADLEKDDLNVDADQASDETGALTAADDQGGFQASRRLCDDGSCVGVIGDDGRCSVCHRAAEA
jgi:hypothetical protein